MSHALKFFVGLHVVAHAKRFKRCTISVNRLRDRKADFVAGEWLMDSGAFTEISQHGEYRTDDQEYVHQVRRWASCGKLLRAVSRDYMCEEFILAKTGLKLRDHQLMTVDRYHNLSRLAPDLPWMPVLQGFAPSDYVTNILDYGRLLPLGTWVGVGSVCKRNASATSIEDVLLAIYRARPDLRLHGFGLKKTALVSPVVRELLYSADSMAWSFSARKQGRNGNAWEEAMAYSDAVEKQEWQETLFPAKPFAPKAEVEALGKRAFLAYERIGGAERFTDQYAKVEFLLRDFKNAYKAVSTEDAGE